jgi:hypothetical protein
MARATTAADRRESAAVVAFDFHLDIDWSIPHPPDH